MNKHQAIVNTLRSLLALIDCPNCKARQAIEQSQQAVKHARELSGQAQRVQRDFNKWLSELERHEHLEQAVRVGR